MYESFYSLTKRPFAAAPDANLFVATPAVAEALTRLERCVRQARGVAVLTGGAGIGKTHLLHRLAIELQQDFGVIHLPNASFPTPRGFLQCLLAEIGESYERLGETELRLRLTAAANHARATTNGIVLLLDEAHRFSDRLFEEIRLTANQIEAGEPLFRVVIAGQIALEDRLAEGTQSGLNERTGEVVTLPRLTAEESRTYLAIRAAQADGNLDELFESGAVDVMIQACGGIPRCLNQLADHALLLGFVAERATVSESLVREALDDLKRLPLQWHDPRPAANTVQSMSEIDNDCDSESSFDDVVEIGALENDQDCASHNATLEPPIEEMANSRQNRLEWDDEPSSTVADRPPAIPHSAPPLERISDRFARLDAASAERRWLDSWDRADEEDTEIAEPTYQPDTKPASTEQPRRQAAPCDAPRINTRLSESDSTTEPRSKAEVDQGPDVDLPAPRTWSAAPKPATLFRDLRRRQGLP